VSAEQVVYVGILGSLSGNRNGPGLDLGTYRVSDGSPIWPRSVHLNDGASLLVCGTTLYAVGSRDVRALRAEDGTGLWDDNIGGDITLMAFALPVVGIDWGGFVYLLNAPHGKLVWKVPSAKSLAGQSIQVLLISQTGQSLGCGQTS
jgi:outer membrane protein assembly factor BamB